MAEERTYGIVHIGSRSCALSRIVHSTSVITALKLVASVTCVRLHMNVR